MKKNCIVCKKIFKVRPYRKLSAKYCSRKCKHRGQEDKIKYNCLICKKKIIIKRSLNGKYCSRECFYKSTYGNSNPNWRGGITIETKKRLNVMEWDILRSIVYKRDNYTCKICGSKKRLLHCHHIVPYRITQDNSIENLITLCVNCHSVEEWKYYNKLKIEGGKYDETIV